MFNLSFTDVAVMNSVTSVSPPSKPCLKVFKHSSSLISTCIAILTGFFKSLITYVFLPESLFSRRLNSSTTMFFNFVKQEQKVDSFK